MYGPHLMLDCYECDRKALDDLNTAYRFLDKLPEKIRMTKITKPYIFRYEGTKPIDRGITGVVIIAESHISIHTYPEKNYVTIDVYSCKDFEPEIAVNFVKEVFKPKEINKKFLYRGKKEITIPALKSLR